MSETGRINCLAVDGSESSKNAFDWYLQNYHINGDTLVLIHVYQMPSLSAIGSSVPLGEISSSVPLVETIESSINLSKNIINSFTTICEEKKIKYIAVIEDNNPLVMAGKVICESVKKNLGNIIVLGQRGLGKVKRYSLGSTSDYVLHNSEVPVVVVPTEK